MKNEMAIFTFDDGDVRIVNDEMGNPWFVAKDVTARLGYKWDSNLVKNVPDEWKGVNPFRTLGGVQEMITLSEQGLYFFLGRSDKEKALPFQKWIAGEVMPQIRKTGSFGLNPVPIQLPKTYLEALKELVVVTEQLESAKVRISDDFPKVEFFNQVADSKDAIDMGTAAKVLNCGIGRNDLFQLLRTKEILMTSNIPYQTYIDRGYFRTVEQRYTLPDGSTHISIKTLVYQKGLDFIRRVVKDSEGIIIRGMNADDCMDFIKNNSLVKTGE